VKKLEEINESDSAKRKLKNISKNNNLPLEFVTTLYKFRRDLDPKENSWDDGFVKEEQYTQNQFEKGVEVICKYLDIDKNNIEISKKEMVSRLMNSLKNIDKAKLKENLLIAGETKNNCYLSEYATTHYLNNYSEEKLLKLGKYTGIINFGETTFIDEKYTIKDFMWFIYRKVNNSGCIDKASLFYCYTDLCFNLPYEKTIIAKNDWINTLITNIKNQKKSNLSDLIKCC